MSAVHSMTGFSSVEGTLADGRGVSLQIKSVNGRHLEVQMRLPGSLEVLEPELRMLVKGAVRRGHVEVIAYAERASGGASVQVNEAMLAEYVEVYRRAAARFALVPEPDLHELLRMPGVVAAGSVAGSAGVDEDAAAWMRAAAVEALDAFNRTRAREGAALASDLREAVRRLLTMAGEAADLRRQVGVTAVDRLRARLTDLVGDGVEVTPERLLTEAAMVVTRGDVEEELVRLRTHLQRFTALLDAGGEVGKSLEFLLQELHRETNTLLAKTGGAAGEAGLRLTDLGLAMKVELERAREQVQNLE